MVQGWHTAEQPPVPLTLDIFKTSMEIFRLIFISASAELLSTTGCKTKYMYNYYYYY